MKTGFQRLVIVLLVLNLIVVSAFWMLGGGRMLGNGNRDGGGAGPRNEIVDRLHFDATQVTQYDSLIAIHRKSVGEKESEIQALRTALFVGVADGISEGRKDSLVSQIGVLQAEIQRIHFAHFLDIQRICKPSQQSDFALLTKDLAKMFRGRGPKGKPDSGSEGNSDGGQKSKRDGDTKSEAQ